MSTGQGDHHVVNGEETRVDLPDDPLTRLEAPAEQLRPALWDDDHETRYDGNEGATRHELRPGETRREGPGDGETRVEPRGDPRTRVDTEGQGHPPTPPLPSGLAARFRVVEELRSQGSEARVWLVEIRDSGEEVVLKVYRPGRELESAALAALQAAAGESYRVVCIHEFGQEGGLWYEVQEHCRHGSLQGVMRNHGVDPIDLVQQLAPTLEHLEGRVFHRDLKPANVLVRSIDPFEVVVGDFGLALNADAYGTVYWAEGGTRAYQPPEAALNRVTVAWDWWSLGMIVAEAALGRHPLAGGDGRLPYDASIPDRINRYAVDVSGIEDERLRTLCRGLLLRDSERRWRAEQVAAWRAGEAVDVPADTEPNYFAVGTADPRETLTPVRFAGREHSDPESLAEAFQDHWDDAREQLFGQDGHDAWRQDVAALLNSYGRRDASEMVARGPSGVSDGHRSLAFLLLAMDPRGLRPIFNGVWLTRQGLQREARNVLEGAGTAACLAQLRQAGVLTAWQSLPDLVDSGSADIDRRWRDGCRRVDELVYDLGPQAEGLDAAVERAKAWLLLCAIDRSGNYARDLRRSLRNTQRSSAREADWWRRIAAEGEASPRALPAAALAMATEPIARLTPRQRDQRWQRGGRGDDQSGPNGHLGWDRSFGGLGGATVAGGLAPGGSLQNPLVRSVASWPRTIVMAGLLVFNLWLISRFGSEVREFSLLAPGEGNVDMGPIDALERSFPQLVALLVVFIVVQLIGRWKRRSSLYSSGRGYAALAAIVHLVVIAGIVWSGWVNMLVGGVATASESAFVPGTASTSGAVAEPPGAALPDWSKSLQPFYLLLVITCILLFLSAVVVLGRAARRLGAY